MTHSFDAACVNSAALEDCVTIAAAICGASGAFILTLGEAGPHILASQGLEESDASIVEELITLKTETDGFLIIRDALKETTLGKAADTERRTGFCAALQLNPDTNFKGFIGVIDRKPRPGLTPGEQEGLKALARQLELALSQAGTGAALPFTTGVGNAGAIEGKRHATEDESNEEQIRGGEELYRQLIETAYEGVWIVDEQAVTTYVNERLTRMLGYTREEMLGRPVFDFIVEEEQEHARQNLEQRRRGKVEQFERRLKHKNGETLWVMASLSPIIEEGRFKGALGMITDINEIKKAQADLKEALDEMERRVEERTRELSEANAALRREISEHLETEWLLKEQHERFDFVARATNDLIYDWDIPSDMVWFNDAAEALLGYPGGTVREGKDRWLQLVHPRDREGLEKRFQNFLATKQQLWSAEYRVRRMDGSYVTLFDQAYLIYDEDGNPRRFVGTASDISARVQAEEARKKLLHSVVAAYEEERKRVARELHDQLSQQLIAMNLVLESLKAESSLSERAVRQVEGLQRELDELAGEVTRIEWNLHPAALEGADLYEAIQNQVEQWSERARIQLLTDIDVNQDKLSLPAKTCLFRLIQESLTNIYKHSKAREVTLSLKERGGEVLLVIADDGVGFDLREQQERAASGLGLRSMRERVELLGGHFDIETSRGSGTSIFARLPLTEEMEVEDGEAENTAGR